MIDSYANQDATLQRYLGPTPSGNKYDTSIPIKVRYEQSKRLIRNSQGKEIISRAFIASETELNEEDLITYNGNTFPIITADPAPGLMGNILFYEAYL